MRNMKIDLSNKKILDVTCGSKTIWFDKNHPAAVFCDKRVENLTKSWGGGHALGEDLLCQSRHNLRLHSPAF